MLHDNSPVIRFVTLGLLLVLTLLLPAVLVDGTGAGIVFFVFGLLFLTILLVNPRVGLYAIFICAMTHNPSIKVSFMHIYLSNVLMILFFMGFVYKKLLHPETRLRHTFPETGLIGILLFMLGATSQDGVDMALAAKRIFAFMLFLLPYYFTLNLKWDNMSLQKFARFISLGSIWSIFLGLYSSGFSIAIGQIRIAGPWGNPNAMGAFLAMTLPVSLAMALCSKHYRSWYRLIHIFAVPIIGAGLILTGSRGAIVASLISVITLLLFSKFRIVFITMILPLIGAGVVLLAANEPQQLIPGSSNSIMARWVLWHHAVELIIENPLTGIGTGNYMGSAIPYDSKTFNTAFNSFLTLFSESGVGSCLSLILFFAAVFFEGWRIARKTGSASTRALATGLYAASAGFLMNNMYEDLLFAIMVNWIMGVFIGMLFSIRYIKDESDHEPDHAVAGG